MKSQRSRLLADYIVSLPQKASSLREQAQKLTAEADQIEAVLSGLDLVKLDNLVLTDNPKVDAALRLSMEYPGEWLLAFPDILKRLENLESQIAGWKDGGLVFVDLTSQVYNPPCPVWIIAEVKAGLRLQIVAGQGYFHDIHLSIRIIGKILLNMSYSNNWKIRRINNPTDSIIDLTQMFHPNWA